MRWRLLWASLVAAWAPLGARGGQGGEAKDDLVVVPCCGLGNRVTVLMEAMAMGVAWGMTPVLSWAAGSVLGASFEDLFEAHPDLASGARATLGPRGGGKKKKDDPEQRSDAKSGGKGTCAAEGQAARAGLGLGGAALVPVAEEVLCAGADPPRGPCVFANCGRLSSGPEGTRRFRRVADVWAPRERPALLDGAWRANGTAVSSIETFEATGGFRVTTIRVDDAKFCSDRILEWLAGLAPQAAVLRKVPKRLAGYPRDAVLGVHLRGPDPWAARGNWTSKFDLCVGAHTFAEAVLREADRDPKIRAVYVASNDPALLRAFEAAVAGRLDVVSLETPDVTRRSRGDAAAVQAALADLWALAGAKAVFRGFHSTFGQVAAVLRERPNSVVVHRAGCASEAAVARMTGAKLSKSLFCYT